ncbi:hypothetical protein OE88DRAFT_1732606, partial [Heliocybe sulcata]
VTSDAEVSESGDIKPAINEVPVIKRSKTSAVSGAEGKQESNVSKTDNTTRDTKVKKTASTANVVDLVSDDDGDQETSKFETTPQILLGVDSDQDDDVKIIDRDARGVDSNDDDTGSHDVDTPDQERTDLTLHESLRDPDLEDTYNLPLLTR